MESKIMSVISSKFECLPIKSSLWTRKYRSGHVTWQLPERGEPRGRGVNSPLAIFLTSYVWIETKSSIFFFFLPKWVRVSFSSISLVLLINIFIHPLFPVFSKLQAAGYLQETKSSGYLFPLLDLLNLYVMKLLFKINLALLTYNLSLSTSSPPAHRSCFGFK